MSKTPAPTGYRYAAERCSHPEGSRFMDFFERILYATRSAWERSVLCDRKDELWLAWKAQAARDGAG